MNLLGNIQIKFSNTMILPNNMIVEPNTYTIKPNTYTTEPNTYTIGVLLSLWIISTYRPNFPLNIFKYSLKKKSFILVLMNLNGLNLQMMLRKVMAGFMVIIMHLEYF